WQHVAERRTEGPDVSQEWSVGFFHLRWKQTLQERSRPHKGDRGFQERTSRTVGWSHGENRLPVKGTVGARGIGGREISIRPGDWSPAPIDRPCPWRRPSWRKRLNPRPHAFRRRGFAGSRDRGTSR